MCSILILFQTDIMSPIMVLTKHNVLPQEKWMCYWLHWNLSLCSQVMLLQSTLISKQCSNWEWIERSNNATWLHHIQFLAHSIIIHSFNLAIKSWSLIIINTSLPMNVLNGCNLTFLWIIYQSRQQYATFNRCHPLIGHVSRNLNRKRLIRIRASLSMTIKNKIQTQYLSCHPTSQLISNVKYLKFMMRSVKSNHPLKMNAKGKSLLENAQLLYLVKVVIWASGFNSRRNGVDQKLLICHHKLQLS